MKTDLENTSKVINRALKYAVKHGYVAPSLEKKILLRLKASKTGADIEMWAKGLLFDHNFAHALFGAYDVDDNGWSVSAIEFWAKQVAVEVEGELRAVLKNWPKTEIRYAVTPELDIQKYSEKAPMELVEAQIVTKQLVRMAASIPFETHSIDKVEIHGTKPAYLYHLQQMALSPNPVTYVKEYLDLHE